MEKRTDKKTDEKMVAGVAGKMKKPMKNLLKEPRVLLALVFIVISVAAINPKISSEGVSTNIVRGLDLQGGVRALILPENASKEIVERTIDILAARVNAFGLREIPMRAVQIGEDWRIQMEWAGATQEEVRNLIEKQGKFEAFINQTASLTQVFGVLKFNGKEFSLQWEPAGADRMTIQGATLNRTTLSIGQSVTIDDVELTYAGVNQSKATFMAKTFTGRDILRVFRDPTRAQVAPAGNAWRFQFQILLSSEAAERFAKVTRDMPIAATGAAQEYLAAPIDFYLDGNFTRSLQIGASLRGQALTEPVIEGPAATREAAKKEMNVLQAILESGALPTSIKIESIQSVSAALGAQFMQIAVIGLLGAIIFVSFIIYARYKDIRIVLPIILTSGTEILLIFGIAAAVKWTIDLAAIAGIMAAIGTGVDNQIVITDETAARKKEKEVAGIAQKMKQAFFIIFTSAFAITGAMIPLFLVGASVMKGFALTTLLGVWVGVLITRPMYAKILEYQRG